MYAQKSINKKTIKENKIFKGKSYISWDGAAMKEVISFLNNQNENVNIKLIIEDRIDSMMV